MTDLQCHRSNFVFSFQMSISTLVFLTWYHYFPSFLRREVRLRESIKQEKLTQTDLFDFLTMASLVSSSRFRQAKSPGRVGRSRTGTMFTL